MATLILKNPIPTVPANVQAVGVSPASINVTWADTNDGTAITEVWQSSNNRNWVKVADVAPEFSSRLCNIGTVDTTRYFKVRARIDNRVSKFSSVVSDATLSTPTAASGVTLTVLDENRIQVDFTINQPEADHRIEISLNSSDWTEVIILDPGIDTYTITGLNPGTLYYVSPTVTWDGIDGTRSIASDTTDSEGGSPPGTPTSLVATALTPTSIGLTWTLADATNTSLKVYRSDDDTDPHPWTLLNTLGPAVESYIDTTVAQEETWYYYVVASNAAGDSADSNEDGATTPAPSDLTLLLNSTILSSVRASAAAEDDAWLAFYDTAENDINGGLNVVTGPGDYQGGQLNSLPDHALCYQALKISNPTLAAAHADKAIAILVYLMRDNIRLGYGTRHYLARGDGVTTVFNLPYTDNINAATFKVWRNTVSVVQVNNHVLNSRNEVFSVNNRAIKVSNTSDGPADYTERTIVSHYPLEMSAGDWSSHPDIGDGLIDWAGAANQPAAGATYYITRVPMSGSSLAASNYTLDTQAGTLTFNVAPTTSQAIFVEYQYGTPTQGASTLGYQQTGSRQNGFNNILMDATYTGRYLGKFGAMALDWLGDYAGFAQYRDELIFKLKRWFNHQVTLTWPFTAPTNNYGIGHWVSRVFTAVVLKGIGDPDGETLMNQIHSFRDANLNRVMTDAPIAGQLGTCKGGIWAEGPSYGNQSIRNYMLAELALREAGEIVGTEVVQWAGDLLKCTFHAQPWDGDVVYAAKHYQGSHWNDGDVASDPVPVYAKDCFYLAAHLTDDADLKAYANEFIQNPFQNQTSEWQDMMYRDPAAATADWTLALPLHYFAEGLGLILARTDWTYDSTWVSWACGQPTNAAAHFMGAPGHLRIQRGGDDLLVSVPGSTGIQGTSGDATHTPPNKKCTAANWILCDDNDFGHQNYRWNAGINLWHGNPGCRVLKYEFQTAYVYAAGQYGEAYSKNTAIGQGGSTNLLQRSWFFVRPDVVVCHDRVSLKDANCYAELNWHFRANPNLAGDAWDITRGSSKLFGTTVSSIALTTVESGAMVVGNKSDIHRISSYPTTPTLDFTLCTSLQTAASAASGYTVARVASGSDFEGVIVNGTLVCLFGVENGPVSTSGGKSYTVTQTGTATHYIADLTPDQQYTLSGDASGTPTATSAGVVTFSVTGSGSKTVTIT